MSQKTVRRVLIKHPRTPYTVIPVDACGEDDLFCIVELTHKFYRILHIDTGITISDTKTKRVAREFIKRMRWQQKKNSTLRNVMNAVTWEDYCRHSLRGEVRSCIDLDNFMRKYTDQAGHVPRRITKDEKFLHPMEFLTS